MDHRRASLGWVPLRGALGALTALLALVTMAWGAEPPPPGPTWVVDPAGPGPQLPPAGASLFDMLFAGPGGRHALPFPFEALVARIGAELVADPGSTLPPVKAVLIPLGRSLQRSAAAPDYFRFPRVVIAADGAPAPGSPWLLRDRLYIGYLEKAAVLEVISYNEAAGRFEFQLVSDYRAGGQPRVRYANRNVCFACHHNGAPIFSRALWDETNANPAVAALLEAQGRDFHGIAPRRGVDLPYAIDNAVRRANRLALTQRLWQEGCGPGPDGQHCRAGLYAAALRLRLADGLALPPAQAIDARTAATLKATAARLWPGGLALGRADLPNRNPLQGLTRWPDDPAARQARAHVPAAFDPLAPRLPDSFWRADGADAVAEAVGGLAGFVADGDWARFQAALARQGAALPRVVRQLTCTPLPASRASRCQDARGASLDLDPDSRQVRRLSLDGEAARAPFALTPRPGLRLAGGDVLEALDTTGVVRGQGRLRLTVRADSQALGMALARIAGGADADLLPGGQPFPRAALMRALLTALGDTPRERPGVSPPPALAADPGGSALAEGGLPASLAAFQAWCAACHLGSEASPPNFLHGPADGLAARLRQCAPRIYVRLAMARLPFAARAKTPMPPETLLPALGTHPAAWAASPARAGLEVTVAALLKAESGRDPDIDSLLAGGYEALRPCLAPTP
ncbi:hypothetical protein [Zoogloea sp.]|uniref:hypothetical protein n=1 Tax=Zoogloea sp. TaxID=49181 RepID=UPI0025E496C2|nr:hypothetical protein [Zoogloea sp.]MCK6394577.1 hypothetical protein [Zoogloea sp.]